MSIFKKTAFFLTLIFGVLLGASLYTNTKIKIGEKPFYYLSICSLFQDEAPYLKEWIEYNKLLGVEHFYLYNNNSTDDYMGVLAPYIKEGSVELKDWKTPQGLFVVNFQEDVYKDWLTSKQSETFWLAIIDIDEFIVPVNKMTIPEVLKDYEAFGGLTLFWHVFGTSNLASIPEDKLMIESLTLKHSLEKKKRFCGKMIVRPAVTKKLGIHNSAFIKDYFAVTTDKVRSNKAHHTKLPLLDRMHINHYHYRAEDFFYTTRISRIERKLGRRQTKEELAELTNKIERHNKIEDKTIFKFVDALRKRMGKDANYL